MQTHSIEFGKHGSHAHSHAYGGQHAQQMGGHFAMSRPKSSGDKQHDALVNQTEKWVSQTFYGEMLKQMRKSPFKSKIFDGGEGGEAFTEMFDQHLADKMSKGAGRKLVDSIVNKIEAGKARKAYAAHVKKPADPAGESNRNMGLGPMRAMSGSQQSSASDAKRTGQRPLVRERSREQPVVHHYAAIKPPPLSPTLRAEIGALP